MSVSELKFYSIGVVAENKKLDSHEIEVAPIESSTMVDGEITSNADKYEAKAEDSEGSAYQVELTTTNSIKATWIPMGMSNRKTAPDVRRGERVMLYRVADTDQFYWATLMDDLNLRKLETVIYAFSSTKDEGAKCGPDTTYFLEISTHKKLVHFHTSKSDGEPYTYDIQLNTKEGFFKMQDDIGNYIGLDSKEHQIELRNTDNSRVDINKKEIFIESDDLISLKSKVIRETSTNHFIKATTLDIQAETTHTGNITENGNTVFNGNVTETGAMSVTGEVEFTGNVNVTGPVEVEGIVTAITFDTI